MVILKIGFPVNVTVPKLIPAVPLRTLVELALILSVEELMLSVPKVQVVPAPGVERSEVIVDVALTVTG